MSTSCSFPQWLHLIKTTVQNQNQKQNQVAYVCRILSHLTHCVDSQNHHHNQDTELLYNHKGLPHATLLQSHPSHTPSWTPGHQSSLLHFYNFVLLRMLYNLYHIWSFEVSFVILHILHMHLFFYCKPLSFVVVCYTAIDNNTSLVGKITSWIKCKLKKDFPLGTGTWTLIECLLEMAIIPRQRNLQ